MHFYELAICFFYFYNNKVNLDVMFNQKKL